MTSISPAASPCPRLRCRRSRPVATAAAQTAPPPAAPPHAPTPLDRAVHAVHAAERAARDPARGPHRAARDGQRLVSRRLGAREARTHRLRASVRAPDVRGLRSTSRKASSTRCSKAAGGDQQRLDRERPDELLHRRAVERARAGALPRVGSHGLPARRDVARTRQRPARRRQERAAAELRERARTAWRRSRSTRCSIRRAIRTAGRRSATWRI